MDDKALPTLDEIYKLVKDNNQMLHSMRRQAFMKGVLGFIWWVLLFIVVPYLTYIYFKPYLDQISALYGQIQGQAHSASTTMNSINASIKGLPDFSKLFQQFLGGGK